MSCLYPWSVTQDVPGPEQRTGPRFTSAGGSCEGLQVFPWGLCPVQRICPTLAEVINQKPALSLDTGTRVGGRPRGRLESRRFGESGPGGLQGHSPVLVDMAVPTPTTASGHRTQRPLPGRHSGASVTVTQARCLNGGTLRLLCVPCSTGRCVPSRTGPGPPAGLGSPLSVTWGVIRNMAFTRV